MGSRITVTKVSRITTDTSDEYTVVLKGRMQFSSLVELIPEAPDIELRIKGIKQRELLIENGIYRVGATKEISVQNWLTSLESF